MRIWTILGFVLVSCMLRAQIAEGTMKPSLWLPIWDNVKNSSSIQILSIGYNDIPRELNVRGVLVEALEVLDKNGTNLIVCTQTGMFPVSVKNDQGLYEKMNDRAELSFYHFLKVGDSYQILGELHDEQDCDGFDLYNGFTKESLAITDLNGNGIAEVSFQITKSCRSDVSPAERKLFFFESGKVFYLQGETTIKEVSPAAPVASAGLTGSYAEKYIMDKWSRFEADDFMQFSIK